MQEKDMREETPSVFKSPSLDLAPKCEYEHINNYLDRDIKHRLKRLLKEKCPVELAKIYQHIVKDYNLL